MFGFCVDGVFSFVPFCSLRQRCWSQTFESSVQVQVQHKKEVARWLQHKAERTGQGATPDEEAKAAAVGIGAAEQATGLGTKVLWLLLLWGKASGIQNSAAHGQRNATKSKTFDLNGEIWSSLDFV